MHDNSIRKDIEKCTQHARMFVNAKERITHWRNSTATDKCC